MIIMRPIVLVILLCTIGLSNVPTSLAKDIYRYVDKQGNVHFTDRPPEKYLKKSKKYGGQAAKPRSSVKIYKFVDKRGVVHFTDARLNSNYTLVYQGAATLKAFSGERYPALAIHRKYADYKDLVDEAAATYGLEPALIHAVIQAESAYNPKAVSPKGAVGLMQLMPATAKRYGVKNRRNATQNVLGGTRYLRDLLKMFNYNKRLALAGYNAGEGAVKKYGNKIPPYKETQNYVRIVMGLYQQHLRQKL